MDHLHSERYSRHFNLPGFGSEGQLSLQQASVLVVGAGGLGCPVLMYLTSSGVGTIGLIDNDVVALSNISRQVLYSESDIGKSKVKVATAKLQAMNSESRFVPYNELLTQSNALRIFPEYHLIIDCTDNFETRYLINDACVLLSKTFIHGAVYRYTGQVAVMNYGNDNEPRSATYRCLFPEPPASGAVGNCETAGVLSTLTGITGTMQATLAIKVLSGTGHAVAGKLFLFNAQTFESHSCIIPRNLAAFRNGPSEKEDFLNYDYGTFCNSNSRTEFEISPAGLYHLLVNRQPVQIIDIRQSDEWPPFTDMPVTSIPMEVLINNTSLLNEESTVVLLCTSGQRSLQMAGEMSKNRPNPVLSLRGGVNAWNQFKTGVPNE